MFHIVRIHGHSGSSQGVLSTGPLLQTRDPLQETQDTKIQSCEVANVGKTVSNLFSNGFTGQSRPRQVMF